ncbi:hypothetical protein ABT168_01405 [Streptomyces sp. NPDC001793]|uniref:hypothetical protein n=1 Tax=Streptomyces sp. NPDC001793 TaxID=3154657 RepID=UPI003323CFD7
MDGLRSAGGVRTWESGTWWWAIGRSASSTTSPSTGMLPVDDTALAVTDTGGPGIPIVYLNGHVATQGYWRRS